MRDMAERPFDVREQRFAVEFHNAASVLEVDQPAKGSLRQLSKQDSGIGRDQLSKDRFHQQPATEAKEIAGEDGIRGSQGSALRKTPDFFAAPLEVAGERPGCIHILSEGLLHRGAEATWEAGFKVVLHRFAEEYFAGFQVFDQVIAMPKLGVAAKSAGQTEKRKARRVERSKAAKDTEERELRIEGI